MTRHQYGISALVSQTSFRGKIRGGVAKCRVFSQAKHGSFSTCFVCNAGNPYWNKKNFSAERNSALELPLLYIEIVVIAPEMNN